MPKPKFEEEIRVMKNEALSFMQSHRAAFSPIRAIKRSWKYKDGKKNLSRMALAAGVTTLGVVVGVVTHGAALPIIAALAAGQYAVGKMGDSAFMALYGNQYKGATRTREFIENYTSVDFDTEGEAKRLSSRAHSTIRRACQHYRKGWEKLDELQRKVQHPVESCDQAAEQLTLLWQAKRHLDKAWLYIHPACYLSRAMFNFYKSYRDEWRGVSARKAKEDQLSQIIVNAMKLHEEDLGGACLSYPCYWESVPKGEAKGASPIHEEHLWDNPDRREKKLIKAERILAMDPTVVAASISFASPEISDDTKSLYFDTRASYFNRSVLIKIKHKVTNAWDKKTKSEKAAFGVGQVMSVGLAAGAVGVPDFGKPSEVVLGYASQAVETIIDTGIDASAEAGAQAAAIPGGPLKGAVGTGGAKEGQENLQKAAIHLWEAGELSGKLGERIKKYEERFDENDVCGAVVDIIAEIYTLKHHLVKAQKPLEEAIEMVEECVVALEKDFPRLKTGHNDIVKNINAFMAKNKHSSCKTHCIYAPADRGVFELPYV
jgi:hypothetical protein